MTTHSVYIDHITFVGEDYHSMSSYTVLFLAGMTTVPFNISLIDNSLRMYLKAMKAFKS